MAIVQFPAAGATAADVWAHPARKLTADAWPSLTVGKLTIRPKAAKYLAITAPAAGWFDIRPPAGEDWLVTLLTASAVTDYCMYDGALRSLVALSGAHITALVPISHTLWLQVYLAAGMRSSCFAFVLPDNAKAIGAVDNILMDTSWFPAEAAQADGTYRVFMGGGTRGDGAVAGYIRLLTHGDAVIATLASGTGDVRWWGARDDYHRVEIRNEDAVVRNLFWVGLEVKEW